MAAALASQAALDALPATGGRKWVFAQDSASATDDWVVDQILSDNATSLAGKYYIEYVGR